MLNAHWWLNKKHQTLYASYFPACSGTVQLFQCMMYWIVTFLSPLRNGVCHPTFCTLWIAWSQGASNQPSCQITVLNQYYYSQRKTSGYLNGTLCSTEKQFQFLHHWISKHLKNILSTQFLFRKQKTLQPNKIIEYLQALLRDHKAKQGRAETVKQCTCIKFFSHPMPVALKMIDVSLSFKYSSKWNC